MTTRTITAPVEPLEQKRGAIFTHLLQHELPPGRTLVDLGAGPCLFAKRAQAEGYDVTAVDGRTERLPDDLGDIRFVESDVRDFDVTGYDVVSILGLLYHLTLDDQEALLQRCKGSIVIVETQVHIPSMVGPESGPWVEETAEIRGYEGVVFPEGDNPMASIGNPTSFWHTEPSLLRLFEHCGYTDVRVVEPKYTSKYGARGFYVAR